MRQIKDKCANTSKRRKPQTTKSCALLELPSEIIHMIYKYLEPTDVARLRLASQRVAEIGLEYLVPCIHLRLTPASYNGLVAVSGHPVISKHVYRIQYDSDFMKQSSWEYFELRRASRGAAPYIHERRILGLCTRAQLKLRKKKHEKSETENVQAAYRLYQNFLKDQSVLKQQAFLSSQVTEAFRRLPT